MFEKVIYKGKEYFISVLDLNVRDELVLDSIECLGKLSICFENTMVYNADPVENVVAKKDDIQETDQYFLYAEELDGFSGKSVYVDGEALLKDMKKIRMDITSDNFVETAYLFSKEIGLAYEYETMKKRLEEYKKEMKKGAA